MREGNEMRERGEREEARAGGEARGGRDDTREGALLHADGGVCPDSDNCDGAIDPTQLDMTGREDRGMTTDTTTDTMTKYVLTIGHDGDTENPIEEDSLFTLHMFSPRLVNYTDPDVLLACQYEYPEGHEDEGYQCDRMPTNHPTDHDWVGPEGFLVSYFEHGQCWYGLAGSMTGMPDFQWDGVPFAGFLEVTASAEDRAAWWDELTEDEKIEVASDALETYTLWANGDCYWYSIEEVGTEDCDLGHKHETELQDAFSDSCGGFIGLDYFETEVRFALPLDAIGDRLEVEDLTGGMANYMDLTPMPECEVDGCTFRITEGSTRCENHKERTEA